MFPKIHSQLIFSSVSLLILLIGTRAFQFSPIQPSSSIKTHHLEPRFQPYQSIFHHNFKIFKSALNESKELTNPEISRYSRHLVLGDVGMKGQKDLKNASVLVIGAGGLGSPCLMYLAAAGVGNIGIVVSDNYHHEKIHSIWSNI